MEWKKWLMFIGMISFIIFSNFMGSTAKAAPTGTPFASSPHGTVVDGTGNYVSGKPIKRQKQSVRLVYTGGNLTGDTTINGKTLPSSNITLQANDLLKIKNVGSYQGQPTTLAIKSLANKTELIAGQPPIKFAGREGIVKLEFWLEDQSGSEIKDDQVALILPHKFRYSNSIPDLYMRDDYSSVSNIDNIVMTNTSTFDKFTLDRVGDIYRSIGLPVTNTDMNFVFRSSSHFIFDKQWRNGSTETIYYGNLSGNEFLNPDLPLAVPIEYPPPSMQSTQNDDHFQAKLALSQVLPKENGTFYADPLTIQIDTSNFVKTKDQLATLKITDKNNQDITSQTTVKSTENGKIEITFPKALLQRLEENEATITGNFDLDGSSSELLTVYNQQDGYFHVPIQAKNNQNEGAANKEMLVKMPPPEGSPKPGKTVMIHSSTTNLNPADFVEKLHSVLSNDEVEVIKFKEDTTFDTVGQTEVTVIIRSKLTGVEGSVTVPVEVIGELGFKNVPKELPFENSEVAAAPKTIPRQDDNWAIQIDNSSGKNWQVKAESSPVQDENGKAYPSALVFKRENGDTIDLANGQQVIATGSSQNASPSISWPKDQGVLFRHTPQTMKAGVYKSTINWLLEDTP